MVAYDDSIWSSIEGWPWSVCFILLMSPIKTSNSSMPNVFYTGLDVFDVSMVAMCCLPCLELLSVVCQYHLVVAHDDTFVCQLIDELQLVMYGSCETSLVPHVCNQTVWFIYSQAILWSLGWMSPTISLLPWSYFWNTCSLCSKLRFRWYCKLIWGKFVVAMVAYDDSICSSIEGWPWSVLYPSHVSHQNIKLIHAQCFLPWAGCVWCFHGCHMLYAFYPCCMIKVSLMRKIKKFLRQWCKWYDVNYIFFK
jgi:hypothetical protein